MFSTTSVWYFMSESIWLVDSALGWTNEGPNIMARLWASICSNEYSNKAELYRLEEIMTGQVHLILCLIGCNTLEMIGQVFERFSIGFWKVKEVELQFY